MISGDIEINPGPVTCQQCEKTVRKNSKRLEYEVCKEFVHQKCLKNAVINMKYQQTSYKWTYTKCAFSILPFHNVYRYLDCSFAGAPGSRRYTLSASPNTL